MVAPIYSLFKELNTMSSYFKMLCTSQHTLLINPIKCRKAVAASFGCYTFILHCWYFSYSSLTSPRPAGVGGSGSSLLRGPAGHASTGQDERPAGGRSTDGLPVLCQPGHPHASRGGC